MIHGEGVTWVEGVVMSEREDMGVEGELILSLNLPSTRPHTNYFHYHLISFPFPLLIKWVEMVV